jgi:hypothetical protein
MALLIGAGVVIAWLSPRCMGIGELIVWPAGSARCPVTGELTDTDAVRGGGVGTPFFSLLELLGPLKREYGDASFDGRLLLLLAISNLSYNKQGFCFIISRVCASIKKHVC